MVTPKPERPPIPYGMERWDCNFPPYFVDRRPTRQETVITIRCKHPERPAFETALSGRPHPVTCEKRKRQRQIQTQSRKRNRRGD